MSDEKRSRFPALAFVLSGFLVGIPLSVFGLHLYIKALEERRWAEMRSYCEQVAREVRGRDSKRPVLRGEAVPGNAWEDYEKALASLPSWKVLAPVTEFVEQRPKVDRAKALQLVELHVPALEALRRGASRSHSDRKTNWEQQPDTVNTRPNHLATLAAGRARFLTEDGRPREAMELLLDAAQLGEDCARNGTVIDGLIGLSVLHIVQDELKELLSNKALSREDCQELARELELLDGTFPREADAHALDPMSGGFDYLRRGSLRSILDAIGMSDPISPTWRYGFSERLVIVDAFDQGRALSRQSQEAAAKPWKEARRDSSDPIALRSALKNPLIEKLYHLQQLLSNSPQSGNAFREGRAKIRMLRAAAVFRISGDIPVFDDPYGDKIHSSVTEKHLKLWSVGGDGVDDGGSGDWKARMSKDIVLEIER
jgi:hypothetical protein